MRAVRGRRPAVLSAPTRLRKLPESRPTCCARFQDASAEAEDYYDLLQLPRDATGTACQVDVALLTGFPAMSATGVVHLCSWMATALASFDGCNIH